MSAHQPNKIPVRALVAPAVALDAAALMRATPAALGFARTAVVYSVVKAIAARVATRKDALRDYLIAEVNARGATTDRGHRRIDVPGGGDVTVEARQARKITKAYEDGVRAVLDRRGIAAREAFDAVHVWSLNPSKLDVLIKARPAIAKEIAALSAPTYAVRDTPPPAIRVLIGAAQPEEE